MAHQKKICMPALATHVEQCFQEFTYTPLVVGRRGHWQREPGEALGLHKIVNQEIDIEVEKICKNKKNSNIDNKVLAAQAIDAAMASMAQSLGSTVDVSLALRETLQIDIASKLASDEVKLNDEARRKVVADVGERLDLRFPERALFSRVEANIEKLKMETLSEAKFTPLPKMFSRELPQLGIFFTEATCFRCEGLTYTPCGHESTILPRETIGRTKSLDSVASTTETASEDVATSTIQTDKDNTTTTFVESYDKTTKTTIDLKKETKINLKGKLFKILDADLTSTTTGSFNHFIEKVNKSSSTIKRDQVHEVVQSFSLNQKSSRTFTNSVTEKDNWTQSITNPSDAPLHYIEREAHCVYSVIQKRTNVHLAWSGCLDNPGRLLCTPDNLEIKHALQIQAIKDKWSKTAPPTSFGSRPANVRICTPLASQDGFGSIGADNVTFTATLQALIPVGHGYVSGTAVITSIESDTDVTSTAITSQPGNGSSGIVGFSVEILVNNKFANKEWVRFQVCFDASTPEAAAYDAKIEQWRENQAETEIKLLLDEERKHLDEFLLSDRVAAVIEREIFNKFFGSATTADCCALIGKIRSLFDFSLLSYVLSPNWNELGTGCQTTDPITIYTAKCLNFYLPIKAGKEWEALAVLISINALPADANLLAQIAGYVTSIENLRETVFNRLFDPTGWEDEIDGPHGYNLTPYNTDNTNEWNSPFESSLNYQLIDVHVVTVPCIGTRKDIRPNMC